MRRQSSARGGTLHRSRDSYLLDAHRTVLDQRFRAGFGDPVGLQPVGDRARRRSFPGYHVDERLELGPEGGLEPIHEEAVRLAGREGDARFEGPQWPLLIDAGRDAVLRPVYL